jgi:hypothetical protein
MLCFALLCFALHVPCMHRTALTVLHCRVAGAI